MPEVLPLLGVRDDPYPPAGYVAYLANARRVEGAWATLEGTIRVRDLGNGHDVVSLYEFTRRGGVRHLIIEALADDNGLLNVFAYDWQADSTTLLTTRRRSTTHPQGSTFLSASGWLYILTPENGAIRWDGERIEPVGFPGPIPPPRPLASAEGFDEVDLAGSAFAAVVGTAILRSQGDQRGVGPFPEAGETGEFRVGYGLTYLNELGQESPLSALAFASGTNRGEDDGGRSLVFVDVPPGPPWAVAGRLWRSANLLGVDEPQAAEVYLVDEFTHAGGHQYIDHTPDFELAFALDAAQLGPPPQAPPTGCFWAGYLWLVDGEDPTRLRRSNPLLQEQFAPRDYFTVGTAATGDIVAVYAYQRTMFVFKTGGVFAMVDPNEPPRVLSETHGTEAPKGIVAVPDVGVFFLDRTLGPCVIVGTLTDEQSTAIRPIEGIARTWRRRIGRDLASARVLFDPQFREVWWSVPEGGNRRNTLGVVYHLDTEGWSLRPDWPVDAMLLTASGHRLLGTRQVQPGVDLLSAGVGDRYDSGTPLELELHTAWVETATRTRWTTVELVVEPIGMPLVFVESRADRRPVAIPQTGNGRMLAHPDHDRELYGTGLWGTGEWTPADPDRIPVDLDYRESALSYQLRLSAERLRLYALVLRSTDDARADQERREPIGGSLP